MSRAVAADLEALASSTSSLLRTLADLRDDQVREPSLLPGWTRGHVLTHVARNADGMLNLVSSARTGVDTPMYPSREQRNADIEAGSRRTAAELVADVEASAGRLTAAFEELTEDQWRSTVPWRRGDQRVPATFLPSRRQVEVEIHHVDLDLDYTLAHLPTDFVLSMLEEVTAELSDRNGMRGLVLVGNDNEGRWTVGAGGQEVTGTAPSLLGWLVGRTDGIGLFSAEPLPDLAPWR